MWPFRDGWAAAAGLWVFYILFPFHFVGKMLSKTANNVYQDFIRHLC